MTWLDFKAAVRELLTVDSTRLNVQTFIDRQIRNGVVDIQSNIPFYRAGNVVTYSLNGAIKDSEPLAEAEKASEGLLEGDIRVLDAYFIDGQYSYDWQDDLSESADSNSECSRRPIRQWPWPNRHDMICGATIGYDLIAISPQGGKFYIYPQVTSTDKVEIFYNGLKKSFADTDVTTFDDSVVEAVANFVKSKICREVDRDLDLFQSYWASYLADRSRLYLDARDRVTMKYSLGSELPDAINGSSCASTTSASCDGTTTTTTSNCQGVTITTIVT